MRECPHLKIEIWGTRFLVTLKMVACVLLGGRSWLRLRLLFVFVFAAAEDLLEEVFLLGGCGVLIGVRGVAVWGRVGIDANDGSGGVGCCGVRSGFAAEAEDLLDEVLRAFTHLTAGVGGCGAVEEGGVEDVAGAAGVGEQVGGFVDARGGDASRWHEGFDVGVLRKQDGALHELSPDGLCGVGAFHFYVGVVVIADPDDADEV
jgi:hypothetical protein